VKIELQGEELELFAERAVLWPSQHALIVTDTHFGKAATFRRSGIPVPEETTQADLDRLTSLILSTGAHRLIVLGDLLHAKAGRQPAVLNALQEWRAKHNEIAIDLIMGNHDRAAGAPPNEWNIVLHPREMLLEPFVFVHEPGGVEGRYVMSGHIHPSVLLNDGLHRSARFPCFSFGERQAILPAFGSFTGTYEISPSRGDRIYVIVEDNVIQVLTQ
jgi:uncharacterized protein